MLDPKEYESKEAWFAKINEVWDRCEKELEEKKDDPNNYEYCGYPIKGKTPEDSHYYPINNTARFIICSVLAVIVSFVMYRKYH